MQSYTLMMITISNNYEQQEEMKLLMNYGATLCSYLIDYNLYHCSYNKNGKMKTHDKRCS